MLDTIYILAHSQVSYLILRANYFCIQRKNPDSSVNMATPITGAIADTKVPGEVAVGSLFARADKTPSSDSSIGKGEGAIRQYSDFGQAYNANRADDLPKYHGTFDTINEKSFYTPIERYEGKHRYDPEFEWEPKEEKKLIRKVGTLHRRVMKFRDAPY